MLFTRIITEGFRDEELRLRPKLFVADAADSGFFLWLCLRDNWYKRGFWNFVEVKLLLGLLHAAPLRLGWLNSHSLLLNNDLRVIQKPVDRRGIVLLVVYAQDLDIFPVLAARCEARPLGVLSNCGEHDL